MNKLLTFVSCSLISAGCLAYDERPLVPADVPVQVRFQMKSANSSSSVLLTQSESLTHVTQIRSSESMSSQM